MKTVKFYTLGCKVNQYETQSLRERFVNAGFKEIFNGRKADTYVINTCTVTHRADKDSRYFIRKARSQNHKAKVIVTGCMASKDAADLSEFKCADYVISKSFFPDGISAFSGHTRAFLKIQDGCNNFCSYCIVPFVRGRSRSRGLAEIVCEANKLAGNGFKEIVLTGVCLGAYGRDLVPGLDLVDVIGELEKIKGLLRIRLSSIELNDVSERLINKMISSKKLCRHLHIPLQSGDDEVLKKMKRKYTRKDYLNLIARIKKRIPEIAITTDILVGFPGESEANFRNTLALVKKIRSLKVHIFPYSRRKETSAAVNFNDAVNPRIIKARIDQLQKCCQSCALSYRKLFLNKNMDVLIEGYSKEKPGFWQGHTDNYLEVMVKAGEEPENPIVDLRLKRIVKNYILANFS